MQSVLRRHSALVLVLIIAFAFFTRFYRLDQPQSYVFDEVYHAVTAKLMAQDDPRAYEWWNPPPEPGTAVDWLHPPYAKYTQALSMLVLGQNSFGWRFSSAVFGVLVIALVYLLATELFQSRRTGLIAAALASLDGLLLVQSRVAMNDIHVTFFILLSLFFFQRSWRLSRKSWYLFLTGISLGLAVGTKWSGMYALAVIWLFQGWQFLFLVTSWWPKISWGQFFKRSLTFWLYRLLVLGIIPALLYLAAYTQMFGQGKSLFCDQPRVVTNECYEEQFEQKNGEFETKYLSHFQELHHQIWWYQTNLDATHAYQSRPWQWFLNLRPVWYHVEYGQDKIANIYALGNPLLLWLGVVAVFLTSGWLLRKLVFNRLPWRQRLLMVNSQSVFPVLMVWSLYLGVWLPWQFSPRIMFFYHYNPALPLLCIRVGWWLSQLSRSHAKVTGLILLSIFACFVIWYPLWTNMSVPITFANQVYFAIPSWK